MSSAILVLAAIDGVMFTTDSYRTTSAHDVYYLINIFYNICEKC